MSSIYKKGRDGYYYYQVYTLNLKTGKKDKRVFYSLGTKDIEEAKIKQLKLDKKHKKTISYPYKKAKNILRKIFKFFIVILAFFIVKYFIKNKPNQSLASKTRVQSTLNNFDTSEVIMVSEIKTNDTFSSIANLKKVPLKISVRPEMKKKTNYSLEHKIIRVEKIEGAFSQIKVFIIVDIKSNIEEIKLICKKIKIQHQKFKNIIVCVYSNNKYGIELAEGMTSTKGTLANMKAWLAMYSYNPIEGEYFDENPSSYFGSPQLNN